MSMQTDSTHTAMHCQGLLTAHGHHLDVSPPPVAEPADAAAFTTSRLDGLQAETKFAHDAIMTRLKQSSLIQCACLLQHTCVCA